MSQLPSPDDRPVEIMDETEVYEFLDDLRESGVTNMFTAGPYLRSEFGMSRDESHRWLQRWMKTFSARRAAKEAKS